MNGEVKSVTAGEDFWELVCGTLQLQARRAQPLLTPGNMRRVLNATPKGGKGRPSGGFRTACHFGPSDETIWLAIDALPGSHFDMGGAGLHHETHRGAEGHDSSTLAARSGVR
jgi:hypothetical protein